MWQEAFVQNLVILFITSPLLISLAINASSKNTLIITKAFALLAILSSPLIYLHTFLSHKEIRHVFGGWQKDIGIEYKIDLQSSAMFAVLSVCFFISTFFAKKEDDLKTQKLLDTLKIIAFAGFSGLIFSNDLFNFYVFIEIISIATYATVACGKSKQSAIAGFWYLIFGTIGATFILLSIGMFYIITKNLNLELVLQTISSSSVQYNIAIVVFVVGVLLKIASFPTFSWMLNVYNSTSANFLSFFGSISSKIILFLLLKVVVSIPTESKSLQIACATLLAFGLLNMLYGSFKCCSATKTRELLAFSSLDKVGLFLVIISTGRLGTLYFVIFCALDSLTKSTLFCINTNSTETLSETFAKVKSPYSKFALTFLLLSLAATPLTIGFLPKVGVMTAVMNQFGTFYLFPFSVASFAIMLYTYKILELLYSNKEHEAK